MAPLVLQRKLDALHRCVLRIHDKCPQDAASLARDVDTQDIVVLNLNRAIQLCVDLAAHMMAGTGQRVPDTMADCFDALAQGGVLEPNLALRLQKAVGFRNIAVHAYQNLDWAIVHAIATRHLDDFRQFARAMDAHS